MGCFYCDIDWFYDVVCAAVKKNPEKSAVFQNDILNRQHFIKENDGIDVSFSNRDKLIIGGFIFTLGLIVWGILSKGWYMTEIGALFFALGIFRGLSPG